MLYYLVGKDRQVDGGFGIHAIAFKNAAMSIQGNKDYNDGFSPQKHIPVNYLLRHSAELFLKSMIISVHKFLQLSSDEEIFNLKFVGSNGKSRYLNNTHWLSELHWYWDKLIEDNKVTIEEKTSAKWERPPDLIELIDVVANYDDGGTYFRYPMEKFTTNKDDEKYSMKEISQDLGLIGETNKSPIVYIIKDSDENIKEAYSYDETTLEEVQVSLNKIVNFLDGFHAMTRHTFFNGY